MRDEILREVCKGKGYIICKIPFAEIATYARVTIDDLAEFEAVIQDILDNFDESEWLDLFEHAIINKFGYPITYEFAHNLGMEPGRKMILLKRPVQPGSTKTLVDDTARSKLFVFGDAMAEEIFGADYHLAKISILLNEPDSEHQTKHSDFKPQIIKDDDYSDSDFAVVIAYKHRGNLIAYDYSQHIVHTCQEVNDSRIEVNQGFSLVREKLESNENFKIGVHECVGKEVFFGTDEMMIFGGNFVHGGAKNTMFIPVHKVHFYITKKNRKAPNNQTMLLHPIAWDLTRNGPASKDVIFRDLETKAQYVKYMKEKGFNVDHHDETIQEVTSVAVGVSKVSEAARATETAREKKRKDKKGAAGAVEKSTESVAGASPKKTGKKAAAASSSLDADGAKSKALTSPVSGSEAKKGRPVKLKNQPRAEGSRKRGRPKKADK